MPFFICDDILKKLKKNEHGIFITIYYALKKKYFSVFRTLKVVYFKSISFSKGYINLIQLFHMREIAFLYFIIDSIFFLFL